LVRPAALACAALAFATLATAQERPAPLAQFAPGTVPGTLRYQVAVVGAGAGITAALGALDNLEVLAGPVLAQEVSWHGGQPTAVSVLTWVMRAKHAGPIGVGATRVRFGDLDLATDPVRGTAFVGSRTVAEPPARRLEVEVSAERVMVGEPLIVAYALDDPFPGPAWDLEASFPESWSARLSQAPSMPVRRAGSVVGIMLGAWLVIPARVGRLQIPPAVARPVVSVEDRESPVVPARTVTSRPAAVDVLPLPQPPAAFGGGVGDFRYTRRVLDQKVHAGDLVEVEVKVEGTGNLPLLDPPPLALPPGGEAFPAEETHEWQATSQGLSGFRRWRQPLEFARPGSYELPAVTVCSYRPGSGYATHELPALHVVVSPAPGVPKLAAPSATAPRGLADSAALIAIGVAFLGGAASVVGLLLWRSRRVRQPSAAASPDEELRELALTVERWAHARFHTAVSAGAERLGAAGCPRSDAAEAVALVEACERLRFAPGLGNAAEVLPELRLRVARLTAGTLSSTVRLHA
jgi:hypothetical protein